MIVAVFDADAVDEFVPSLDNGTSVTLNLAFRNRKIK
jgi:hypothetical protein